MRLSYRQQRQLRLIGAGLRQSDPHLGAMFGLFGRLYPGQDMPGWEQMAQVTAGQGRRLRQAAAWIVAALTAAAVAITALLDGAVIMAARRRRARAEAPAANRGRTRPWPEGAA
jgi:hypothetical protein